MTEQDQGPRLLPRSGGPGGMPDHPDRQLDAESGSLAPGTRTGERLDFTRDALLVVTAGTGLLFGAAAPRALAAGDAVWLPHGAPWALAADADGLEYLTVRNHRAPEAGWGPGVAPFAVPAAAAEPSGGEGPCLLRLVCPGCGHLSPDRAARYCARCGGELPERDA